MEEEKEERFTLVSFKLLKSQADLLDELSELTGQNKTTLIRESLSAYLFPLYRRMKELTAVKK